MMAEAALALCSGSLTGQLCCSRRVLDMFGLPLTSLDGQSVIGGAFAPVDVDAMADYG